MISLQQLLNDLFATPVSLIEKQSVVYGQANLDTQPIHILGVKEATFLGAEQAFILADHLINLIQSKSLDPIFLVVDVAGQQLTMRDEWLGMQQYFAHLLEVLECLRMQGHCLISLVYNQAVGGGFIAYGLMADTILALPDAQLAVMWLEGIAKVTKISLDKLQALSKSAPVFAPGANNFYQLGGLHELVPVKDLGQRLKTAIAHPEKQDNRAYLGQQRGGRGLAFSIIEQLASRHNE